MVESVEIGQFGGMGCETPRTNKRRNWFKDIQKNNTWYMLIENDADAAVPEPPDWTGLSKREWEKSTRVYRDLLKDIAIDLLWKSTG